MWWNTVDCDKIPKSPRPKHMPRKPKWHSQLPAGMVPLVGGLEDDHGGGRILAEGSQPSAERTTASSFVTGCPPRGPPAPGDRSRRPKSSPGYVSLTRDGASHSRAKTNVARRSGTTATAIASHRRRPQSAPQLLRGEGLLARRAGDIQEGELVQRMEKFSVTCNIDSFKRQRHLAKDKFEGVEMLADPSYYDLKVLHNGCERAKSAGQVRPSRRLENILSDSHHGASNVNPNSRQLQEPAPIERVRELYKVLDADLRKHAKLAQFKLPRSSVWTMKQMSAGMKRRKDQKTANDFAFLLQYKEEDAESKARRGQEFLQESMGGLFRTVSEKCHQDRALDFLDELSASSLSQKTARMASNEAVSDPLAPMNQTASRTESSPIPKTLVTKAVAQRLACAAGQISEAEAELVGFLIGCCGTVEAAFRTLDVNSDGQVSLKEWEAGVERLGFKDDVACVFRLLGKGADEEATVEDLQALFAPCLEKARSQHK